MIDFGSSCFTRDHLSSYVQSRSYRAPEVILGEPYDGKIDMWSLGAILAELFTGYVLFQNDSVPAMLARIASIVGVEAKQRADKGEEQFVVGVQAVAQRGDLGPQQVGGPARLALVHQIAHKVLGRVARVQHVGREGAEDADDPREH